MAWTKVAPPVKPSKNIVGSAEAVGLQIRRSLQKNKPPALVVVIGAAMLKKLGWTIDQRVEVFADLEGGAFRLQPVGPDSAVPAFRLSPLGKRKTTVRIWVMGILPMDLPSRELALCKSEQLKQHAQAGGGTFLILYGEPSWFTTKVQAKKE